MRCNPVIIIALLLSLLLPASAAALPQQPHPQDSSLPAVILTDTPVNCAASQTWYSPDWHYRKKITINHTRVAGDLTNFPVLISLDADADLRDRAQDDGDDILFTLGDGSTRLAHEMEQFDPITGKLIAWVRVPSLSSSSDTEIYMYYGNPDCVAQQAPEDVWDSSFVMVQHLSDRDASTTADSTSNNNDGTKSSASNPQEVNARIGKGQDFSEDYINCGNLGIGDRYTAECWMKADTLSGTGDQDTYGFTLMASSNDTGYYPLWLTVRGSEVRLWAYEASAAGYQETSGAGLVTGSYFYIVATAVKNSTAEVYVNGELKLSFTNDGEVDWTSIFTMGDLRPDAGIYFDGIMDEVRISNTVRSTYWIQTCYNNQSSPSTFYTVGSEEILLALHGWGWCPLNYKKAGNATLEGALTIAPRSGEPGVSDIRVRGTINLVYPDNSTATFNLDLQGVKTGTAFYLTEPETREFFLSGRFKTAFSGVWLTWETGEEYIDCAGTVLEIVEPEVLRTISPCFFELYSDQETSQDEDLNLIRSTARKLSQFCVDLVNFLQTLINTLTGRQA